MVINGFDELLTRVLSESSTPEYLVGRSFCVTAE